MDLDLNSILYALGVTGLFTSRAFVPAFLTACYVRWGEAIPLIGNADIFAEAGASPTWFTSDLGMMILGGLAALELAGDKIPEAEDALGLVQKYSKPALAGLTYMGVTGAADINPADLPTIAMAGFLDYPLAGVLAFVVYHAGNLRDAVIGYLRTLDENNDIGLRNLISWLEDGWVFFGVIIVFVWPLFALIVIAMMFGVLALLQHRYEKKEEAMRFDCPKCHTSMYLSAFNCPKCGEPNQDIHAVGFWGQGLRQPAMDLKTHAIDLAEHRRCPKCASRLKKRAAIQSCEECGYETFSDRDLRNAYRARVTARLPIVLTVCFGLSLIPILGLFLGIIYYRVQLVSPYRCYMPMHRNFIAKWASRIFFIFLIALQIIPGVGGISVPLMAFLSYSMYRRGFVAQLNKKYV